jgi:hypothetical protein
MGFLILIKNIKKNNYEFIDRIYINKNRKVFTKNSLEYYLYEFNTS